MTIETLKITLGHLQHRDAGEWLQISRVREEHKPMSTPLLVELKPEIMPLPNHHPQVVFTGDDRGHNDKERQQIQELYSKLAI